DDIYGEESDLGDDDGKESDNYDHDPGDDDDDDESFHASDDDDIVEVLPSKSKSKANTNPTTNFQSTTSKSSAKAAAKSSIKATKTAATKAIRKNASTITTSSKTPSANGKTKSKPKPKERQKLLPIPNGWPVSMNSSYPSPRENAVPSETTVSPHLDDIDKDTTIDTSSKLSNAAKCNYLKPGTILQQSCNGSDVFLRKRAVQSTSMKIPSSSGAGTASKGGPTRFLIVFPGRLSLKSPEISITSKNEKESELESEYAEEKREEVVEINGDDDDDEYQDLNDDNYDNDDDGKRKKNHDKEEKLTKNPRNPFAPTHPPQLLGTLVSLGGEERKIELRVPFPSSNAASPATGNVATAKQLVFSGRVIPLSGKYISLSFKRTGGGGGKVDTSPNGSSSHSNKKMGTGSILCKDIFRSVIVLGESQVKNGEGDHMETEEVEDKQPVEFNHYGGSERTLDGGGPSKGGRVPGRKSVNGRKSLDVTARRSRHVEVDESQDDSENSINVASDIGDDDESDPSSDDEFVPTSLKNSRIKHRNAERKSGGNAMEGIDDHETPEAVSKRRLRTPRRSASSAKKVNYADEASDVDMDSRGSSTGDDGGDEDAEGDGDRGENQTDNDDDDDDDSDADLPETIGITKKTGKKLSTINNDSKTNNTTSKRMSAGRKPTENVRAKYNDTEKNVIPKESQKTSRRRASSAKNVIAFDESNDMDMNSKSSNKEVDDGAVERQRDNGDEEDVNIIGDDGNADVPKNRSGKSKTGKRLSGIKKGTEKNELKSCLKSPGTKSRTTTKVDGSGVDEMDEVPKRRQQAPRRSASIAKKVNYADEASEVDMDSKTSDNEDDDGDVEKQGDSANEEDRNGNDGDDSDADYKKLSGRRSNSSKKLPTAKNTTKASTQRRKSTNSSAEQKKNFVVIDSDDDFSVDREIVKKPSISISPSRTSTATKGKRPSKRPDEKKTWNDDVIEVDSVSTPTKSNKSPSKTIRRRSKSSKNTSPSPRKRRKANSKLSPLRSKTKGWDNIDDDQYKFL
ncbi:hypothetical protein ACHAXS_010957, partial [Conticribra weissflogii]